MASDRADSTVVAFTSPTKAGSVAQKMFLTITKGSGTHVSSGLLGERYLVVAALTERPGDGATLVLGGVHEKRVAGIEGSKVIEIACFLSFLPLLTMRVVTAANDNGVDSNQDSQKPSQDSLHNDQDKTGNSLSGLSNAKFLNENQNADDRQDTDHLDDDVDPVSGFEGERTRPEKQ